MKFKVGDRVMTKGDFSFDPAEGVIKEVPIPPEGLFYKVNIPRSRDAEYDWNYSEDQLEEISKFMIGDKVKIRRDSEFYELQGKHGIGGIVEFYQTEPDEWNRVVFGDGYKNSYRNRDLELFSRSMVEKILKAKKGGIMSLLKKLLKPADALIERYAMTEGGYLNMESVIVQQALLDTDDFKKNLVELCKEKEKEEKER